MLAICLQTYLISLIIHIFSLFLLNILNICINNLPFYTSFVIITMSNCIILLILFLIRLKFARIITKFSTFLYFVIIWMYLLSYIYRFWIKLFQIFHLEFIQPIFVLKILLFFQQNTLLINRNIQIIIFQNLLI